MSQAKMHVLIVDGKKDFREFVRHHLECRSFWVETSSDTLEALSKIHQHKLAGYSYDLVITDLFAPDLDGVDLLRWVQYGHPGTAVLLMTPNENPAWEQGFLRPQFDFLCPRPRTNSDWEAFVNSVLFGEPSEIKENLGRKSGSRVFSMARVGKNRKRLGGVGESLAWRPENYLNQPNNWQAQANSIR